MVQLSVDRNLCLRDGACAEVCPARKLKLDAENLPEEIPAESCIFCGHCLAVCPNGALHHSGLDEKAFLPAFTDWPEPATMDGFLASRRSVREFKSEPVGREVMKALLDVARRAPTASNSQKLRWIVADGCEKVHAVARAVVEGGRIAGLHPSLIAQWDAGYDFVLRDAPTVVVVCAPEEYAWGKEDGAIALTFLELAAEARHIGVCWAGYLTRIAQSYAPLRTLLGVPAGYAVRGGLMLGEGTHTYTRIPPRRPSSVHWV